MEVDAMIELEETLEDCEVCRWLLLKLAISWLTEHRKLYHPGPLDIRYNVCYTALDLNGQGAPANSGPSRSRRRTKELKLLENRERVNRQQAEEAEAQHAKAMLRCVDTE